MSEFTVASLTVHFPVRRMKSVQLSSQGEITSPEFKRLAGKSDTWMRVADEDGGKCLVLDLTEPLCTPYPGDGSVVSEMSHNIRALTCFTCKVVLDREMELGNVVAKEFQGEVFLFLNGPSHDISTK